jgi:GTP-binding protein SAR1
MLAARAQVDAIVFLVDAHDRERFPEAKKELDSLLSSEDLRCAALPC